MRSSRIKLPPLAGLLLTLCASYTIASAAAMAAEATAVLIVNARIVDGLGSPIRDGAVRISGDSIIEVGELTPLAKETVIDAKGLVLAPGFIDTHSHHDEGLKHHLDGLPLLTQGITTTVFGQDGFHQLPLKTFLEGFEAEPSTVNIASYVGHNTLREAVMQENSNRVASAAEVSAMRKLLLEELTAGAFGLSTGLEYEPGIYSTSGEVITLAKATASHGGRYISHMRSEDRFLWEAVDEILEIGRQSQMPVQISHMKLAAKSLWGDADKLLRILDAARADGIDVTADVYPYEYWQSTMWVLLPDRNADNREEIRYVLDELTPADGIIFTHFAANPDYVNKSVAEIAALRGVDEVTAFSDLLKESAAWEQAHPGETGESIMGRSMSEKDIEAFLQWPHTNICSDGGFTGHPRGHGAFPRVLARYVRDKPSLSLSDAVEAMTSRAAAHLGITDRGRIVPGAKADLVLFDPELIQDNAGIRDGQVLSSGIVKVWVNGELTLADGKATDARPGRVLRP
ncbi:MAG: D-aminoacylase [Congregibacter sp.]